MHSADSIWLNRADPDGRRRLIQGETEEVVPGVTAVKVGGHFEGSLVLHWDQASAEGEEAGRKKGWLGIADSFVTVPVRLSSPKSPFP